jgi:DNA repair exonuclease SbcCD ATPase subunit
MKGRANKATDQSVRQARTILTSYSTTKDQNISSQVQTAMKSEMTDVIATMKAQREVMEERLREAERAAIKLRLEQESSRKQITELETKKQETENILQETQMEAKLVRSSSCLELAEKEGEKILVSAELEGVRKERENMSKMIKNLEKAKQDMEGRLSQAKEETTTLKAQNEESTKRVTEVEKDRETMKLKLAQLQTTRGTIEARLKEAEEEGIQLKEERNEKSKQIKRCDNDDDIHQYQNQKDTISRELKKLESERVEMMTMVERLNKSCDNVQGQIGVSRHSIMGMDGSLNSSHVMSNSTREFTSYRPSQRCQSPTRPLQNVSRRSGMERASSQPSLRAEKPKENKSNSWLAKDILNRSQHGLEGGGDRSRDGYQSRVTDPPRQMPKQKRPKADPSVSSRRDDPDDQSRHTGDSASLQMMREKHRASERKLQKAISKGKLNGSQRDHLVRKDGSTRISTSNAQW